jgi:hypothetical protein
MNVFIKRIRKLMGWCPNAKVLEIGCKVTPSYFENGRSRGEKANSQQVKSQFSKIFSRLDVRLFLPTLILTLFYMSMLFLKGADSKALFLGILLPLLIYSLCWKKQMEWYDALVKKPNIRYFSKIMLFFVLLVLIWALIIPIRILFSDMPSSINSESMYSFIAGLSFFIMCGTSLQLIYWEKKNHMKICIKNENGFLKTYAIRENGGE